MINRIPLSMGFSRQENWSGLSFPSLRDLPDSWIEPASLMSPALFGGFFSTSTTWVIFPHIKDPGFVPGSGRSPGGGHGNPLQYSCLENLMDRGTWWATVHRVTQSQTQLSTH